VRMSFLTQSRFVCALLMLLLDVDYLFDGHVMKYDLAELKATALFKDISL
jgi:hypothetical protein